jgi:hypothetical protein
MAAACAPFNEDIWQLMAPLSHSVEELLDSVAALAPSHPGESYSLLVSNSLTFREKALSKDFAMAIVLDALLAKGLIPDGFTEVPGGRQYRYRFNGG